MADTTDLERLMARARECAHKQATPANWHALETALAALLSERDQAREDARRYRWLSEQGVCIPAWEEPVDGQRYSVWRHGRTLANKVDAAIDSAKGGSNG